MDFLAMDFYIIPRTVQQIYRGTESAKTVIFIGGDVRTPKRPTLFTHLGKVQDSMNAQPQKPK